MPKIKGTDIDLGGETYCCPPLCLDDAQAYLPKISAVQASGSMTTPEGIAIVKEVVHAALKRNYPEITLDTVGRGLDLGNLREIMDAVMARSGFKPVGGAAGGAGGAGAS